MRDYERTIVSQYSSSPRLIALIDSFNDCVDPQANLQAFYDDIWNIETAQGYGLDVWGRIVGVNRILKVSVGSYFGFAEATDAVGFNQAAFYSGQTLTANFELTDQAYRQLIFAKAAANITDGSIKSINKILMNLFPNRGNAYVQEGFSSPVAAHFGFKEAGDATGFNQAPFGDGLFSVPAGMQMTYVFDFPLAPFEVSIVVNSGVLPKPAGVKASARYLQGT